MSLSSGSDRAHGSVSSSDRKPTTFTIPDPASVPEHGRTFTAYREGKYYLPNDGDEQDRLDLQHKLWSVAMHDQLHWAPIEDPKHVLDIGTGTGIWAIEFARQHPQAKVVGTDLSLIQPPTAPSNCEFLRDDIEDPWIFPTTFDFVFLRAMCTCFNDHRAVIQKIYDNLEPGGWLECDESAMEIFGADATAEEYIRGSPFSRWLELMKRGMLAATGRDITVARHFETWMKEIGFTDVVAKKVLMPLNEWPLEPREKLCGQFFRMDLERGIESTVKVLLQAGITEEELPAFLEAAKYNLGERRMRGYWLNYVVYGRKPQTQSDPAA